MRQHLLEEVADIMSSITLPFDIDSLEIVSQRVDRRREYYT